MLKRKCKAGQTSTRAHTTRQNMHEKGRSPCADIQMPTHPPCLYTKNPITAATVQTWMELRLLWMAVHEICKHLVNEQDGGLCLNMGQNSPSEKLQRWKYWLLFFTVNCAFVTFRIQGITHILRLHWGGFSDRGTVYAGLIQDKNSGHDTGNDRIILL